jgi:phosphomannomutase
MDLATQLETAHPDGKHKDLFREIRELGQDGQKVARRQKEYIEPGDGKGEVQSRKQMTKDYDNVEEHYESFLDELSDSMLSDTEKQQIKAFVDTHAGTISHVSRDLFRADIEEPIGTRQMNHETGQRFTENASTRLEGI